MPNSDVPDDEALNATNMDIQALISMKEIAMKQIDQCLDESCLKLDPEKTEAIIFDWPQKG